MSKKEKNKERKTPYDNILFEHISNAKLRLLLTGVVLPSSKQCAYALGYTYHILARDWGDPDIPANHLETLADWAANAADNFSNKDWVGCVMRLRKGWSYARDHY